MGRDIWGVDKINQMTQLTDMVYKYASSLFFCVVYEIQSGLYFGELTLFPGCGYEEFIPESWDYTLGNWMEAALQK